MVGELRPPAERPQEPGVLLQFGPGRGPGRQQTLKHEQTPYPQTIKPCRTDRCNGNWCGRYGSLRSLGSILPTPNPLSSSAVTPD